MVLGHDRVTLCHTAGTETEVPHLALATSVACASTDRQARLQELVREHRLEGTPCVAVLEPGDYSLLQVEAPDVDASELRSAIRWRIKDLIDYHVDDAVIDAFEVPGQTQPGRPRMMYAVSARSARVQEQVDVVREAGLDLRAVDISELALRNLASNLPEAAGGVALLFLTADEGIVALVHGPELCLARTLEIGTNQLAMVGNGAGALALDDRRLHDTLALEIQRSLDYFDSFFSLPPIGSLAVAPTDATVPELVDHLDANLALNVRTLDLNEVLGSDGALEDNPPAPVLLAIGGALRREQASL